MQAPAIVPARCVGTPFLGVPASVRAAVRKTVSDGVRRRGRVPLLSRKVLLLFDLLTLQA